MGIKKNFMVTKQKIRHSLSLFILVIILITFNCLWFRDRPTQPPEGTHKELYKWINDEFSVPSGGYKAFEFDAIKQDTVLASITLTEGEKITCFSIIDDENFQKWKSNDPCDFIYYQGTSQGGEFYIWIPHTAKCYFVAVNHLNYTIWVRADITVHRWEK